LSHLNLKKVSACQDNSTSLIDRRVAWESDPDPRFLASLGTLSPVELDHCSIVMNRLDRPEGPVNKSSYFLGDPPPDPRFLASLGTLSQVELDHCSVVDSDCSIGGGDVAYWTGSANVQHMGLIYLDIHLPCS
jgi:hypothetical protein